MVYSTHESEAPTKKEFKRRMYFGRQDSDHLHRPFCRMCNLVRTYTLDDLIERDQKQKERKNNEAYMVMHSPCKRYGNGIFVSVFYGKHKTKTEFFVSAENRNGIPFPFLMEMEISFLFYHFPQFFFNSNSLMTVNGKGKQNPLKKEINNKSE